MSTVPAVTRRAVPGFLAEMFSPGNRFIALIAVLAALGGFLFGYDTGVIGGAEPYIAKSLGIGSFGESWVVGSLLLGAIVGAFLSGKLADLLSRKWTKFVAGVVYTAAALGSAFAPTVATLCAARFVLGIAVGTASFVAPMYISEHSPARLRGGMTAFNQFMITFGILVAYIADFALSGFSHNWRWMLGFGAVPAICLAVAMALVPHTPRWLVQRGREDEARSVLAHSRARDAIEDEIDGIKEAAQSQHAFRFRQLIGPRLRMLVIIGVAMAAFQQILGINTVIYFGATILKFAGYTTSTSVYEAVYLGIINMVGAMLAMTLLDKFGRRPLMITGTGGCVLTLIGMGWFFHTTSAFQHANPSIALALIMAYLLFFEISLGPVFWVMIAEIYPLRSRAKAMAAATMVNWTFNFLVSYFFLQMTTSISKAGTFWLYAGFGVVAVAFFVWKLPETKERSLEDIERQVHGGDTGGTTEPQRA
jgi:sugar porter (SP) family MFS transporter